MADINSSAPSVAPREHDKNRVADPLAAVRIDLTDEELVRYVELLFFAYRDFTGDADELLSDLAYGRAHHRVIHFVGRNPGLRVADLLEILRITKQSLARVLKQLIDDGYINQEAGKTDRRERHLYLTTKGDRLAQRLTELQCARVARSLTDLNSEGRVAVEEFLATMISDKHHAAVTHLIKKGSTPEHPER